MTLLAVNSIQTSATIAQKGSFKNSRSYLLSSKSLLERIYHFLSKNGSSRDQDQVKKHFQKFLDHFQMFDNEIRNAQRIEDTRRYNRFDRNTGERTVSPRRSRSRSRSPTIRRERERDRDRNDNFSNAIYNAKAINFRNYDRDRRSPPRNSEKDASIFRKRSISPTRTSPPRNRSPSARKYRSSRSPSPFNRWSGSPTSQRRRSQSPVNIDTSTNKNKDRDSDRRPREKNKQKGGYRKRSRS